MKSRIHGVLGAVALLCISSFWLASVVAELFMSHASIAAVKSAVLTGMWLLIPSMVMAGGSGFALAKGRGDRLVAAKRLRMKIVAANGVLVLLPSAWVLASWANAGRFDSVFYALQGLELLAGAVNISLLAMNMRDGLRLSGCLKPRPRGLAATR